MVFRIGERGVLEGWGLFGCGFVGYVGLELDVEDCGGVVWVLVCYWFV